MLLSLWFWTCGVFDPWYPWFFTLAFSRFGWTRGVFCLPSGKLLSVPDDPTSDLLLRGIVPVLLFGGGLLFCFRHGLARGQARARLPFTILLFLVLLAYSGLTNLGRSYALRVTYYTYFFSLISAVLVYSLVDFSRLPRRAAVDALALLTLLGALNARQSFCLARQVAAENADVGRYAARIGNFVNKHRDERGFRFAVHAASKKQLDLLDTQLDPRLPFTPGFPDPDRPGGRPVRVSALLYGKYYDETLSATDAANHKYLLTPLD